MYSNSNIQLQVMSHFFIEPCPVTWKMIGKWTATRKVHAAITKAKFSNSKELS